MNSVIRIERARQNNLKNVTVEFPLNQLIVITGLSGSGKTSLAFDTLYAEGQRRYAETFSPYTRQFLERLDKPDVDSITGIPPAIALGQVNNVRTSRSNVGTMTEIADYLKILFPREASLDCPCCHRPVHPWSADEAAADLFEKFSQKDVLVLFPVSFPQHTSWEDVTKFIQSQGYLRLWHEENIYRLDEPAAEPLQKELQKTLPMFWIVQDRLTISQENRTRLMETISTAFRMGKGHVNIQPNKEVPEKQLLYTDRWHCPYDHLDFNTPTPSLFSFNNPVGACPTCRGFGRSIEIDYLLAIPDRTLSLAEGAVKPWTTESFDECQDDLIKACKRKNIPTDVPFEELIAEQRNFVVHGERADYSSLQEMWDTKAWYGIQGFFEWLETKSYKMHVRVMLSRYRVYKICPACQGSRFQPQTGCWKIAGKTLPEINTTPISELSTFFKALSLKDASSKIILDQIISRLGFLDQIGLGYLDLNRATRTLSGGELQRVNLTTCLGSTLTGTLFVLDEPSIGLHPRDTNRLIKILHYLRDQGNTVVVVEHDEAIMQAADQLLELGPEQGAKGGDLVFQGTFSEILKEKKSLTGSYLSGSTKIPLPSKEREIKNVPTLKFKNASKHNLHNLSFSFPLNRFVVITGVSGSGKSTLVHEVIYKGLQMQRGQAVEEPAKVEKIEGHQSLDDVIIVNQSPLSQTPRSTPILYLGAYDLIRDLFASTEDAQSSGLNASAFSFNSGVGRCERCSGSGYEKIEMQFLSDLFLTCPICEGKRFQKHVLQIQYQGKSINEVLDLTMDEAVIFFTPGTDTGKKSNAKKRICQILQLLQDVGLGYLKLGQPLSHLSGGESQRLKLVAHLTEQTKEKKTRLLILDEPTTGLHFDDIRRLLNVLQRLVDQGHSLVVIEHHLDVIAAADWILDMGPEARDKGGKIVVEGTPRSIAENRVSVTGQFLKQKLSSRFTPAKIAKTKKQKPVQVIQILGARHHNLKNISLDIPLNEMVVFTGLSGSGKSTLAFDLLFSEGQRRYLDCLNTYARQFVEQMEKPAVDSITGLPPTVAIEQRTSRGGGKSTVATVTEIYQFMRLMYAKLGRQHDPETDEIAIQQTSREIIQHIETTLKKEKSLTLFAPLIVGRKGFHTEVAQWARRHGIQYLLADGKRVSVEQFKALDRYKEHSIDAELGTFSKNAREREALIQRALQYGKGTCYTLENKKRKTVYSQHLFCPGTGRSFEPLDPRLFSYNSPHGWCSECFGFGTLQEVSVDADSELEKEIQTEMARENAEKEISQTICSSCQGSRLNSVARAVHLGTRSVPEINHMTLREFEKYLRAQKWNDREKRILRDIQPEIEQRLRFLREVGLDYLNLDRSAPTLSGGEAQRIHLAAQLGSNLQGVLYVLDEPTIGLHPRDNQHLLKALRQLQQRGNSLVIVEHDEDTMREADRIIDLGPGAGIHGGQIVAQGSWKRLSQKKESITGLLLGQPLTHPLNGKRRAVNNSTQFLRIEKAHANNLKHIDVSLPLQRLTVLTGVSGAGKSTLLHDVLAPAARLFIDKQKNKAEGAWKKVSCDLKFHHVLEVDQSPIGKTSRSTVCTYLNLMDKLRDLMAQLPEARMRGLTKSHFSHNNGEGRCPACKGQGTLKVEMNFLPTTYVPCETCSGQRWTELALGVKYREKNLFEILQMSVDEAIFFFAQQPRLLASLHLMQEAGLGYLTLGQTSPTLSGGEAQRIKLVTELASGASSEQRNLLQFSQKSHHLYLLEEPTVGLHLADVKRLLHMLHRLVDRGHTVVVIEHHLDLIAEADWILELGPESGEAGGKLLFKGIPEALAKNKKSPTGPFLRDILKRGNSIKPNAS